MGRRFQKGFTLVELMIAMAVLAVVLSTAITALQRAEGSVQQTVTRSVLNTKANRALTLIANRLTGGGGDALQNFPAFPACADEVEYRQVTGYSGFAPEWSAESVIRLEYEPGEINNGIDDDGDGLIDECRIIEVADEGGPEERRAVLATRVAEFLDGEEPDLADNNGNGLVDERGLCFSRDGDALVVRLTVVRINSNGRRESRTSMTTIALRN